MREDDVFIFTGAAEVTVELSARNRSAGWDAATHAEDRCESITPGYRVHLIEVRPYRPRGGLRRRVTLHYSWTGKPKHHNKMGDWEQWAKALEGVEKIATGAPPLMSPQLAP